MLPTTTNINSCYEENNQTHLNWRLANSQTRLTRDKISADLDSTLGPNLFSSFDLELCV